MEKHKKKGILFLFIFLGLMVIFLGIFFVYSNFINNSKTSVYSLIMEIDSDISNGFYDHAELLLNDAVGLAAGSRVWSRLIKRSYIIGEATNNYSLYYKISGTAYGKFPGNTDLTALFVHALIVMEEYDKAVEIAEKKLRNPEYDVIRGEANYLAGNILDEKEYRKNPQMSILFSATEDPSLEHIRHAAETSEISSFWLDYSLLLGLAGDITGAYEIYRSYLGNEFPEYGLFISYDAGDLAGSIGHYKTLVDRYGELPPGQQLFYGDILLADVQYQEASEVYRSFIYTFPDFSWLPYANLAWLNINQDMDPVPVLLEGIERFPREMRLFLLLGAYYDSRDNIDLSISVYRQLLDMFPDNPLVRLISLDYSPESISPSRISGDIWKIINSSEGQDKVVRLAVAKLLRLGLYSDVLEALDQHETLYRTDDWLLFYRGIVMGLTGDFEESANQFRMMSEKRWESIYATGLATAGSGDYLGGISQIDSAIALLKSEVEYPRFRKQHGNMEFMKGCLYNERGDTELARKSINISLSLDKDNLQAALLLDKLN